MCNNFEDTSKIPEEVIVLNNVKNSGTVFGYIFWCVSFRRIHFDVYIYFDRLLTKKRSAHHRH